MVTVHCVVGYRSARQAGGIPVAVIRVIQVGTAGRGDTRGSHPWDTGRHGRQGGYPWQSPMGYRSARQAGPLKSWSIVGTCRHGSHGGSQDPSEPPPSLPAPLPRPSRRRLVSARRGGTQRYPRRGDIFRQDRPGLAGRRPPRCPRPGHVTGPAPVVEWEGGGAGAQGRGRLRSCGCGCRSASSTLSELNEAC